MGGFLRQATASQVRALGPFVDDTDFKTVKTGLTIANTDIKLVVNGGASANKNSGGGTHRVNGVYGVTFDATDTATVGEIDVTVLVSGALLVFDKFTVVEEAVYDALFADSSAGFISLPSLAIAGAMTVGGGLAITNGTTNGHGLSVTGNGTGSGISATGGATGNGVLATGGGTSGHGIRAVGAAGNSTGVYAQGQGNNPGIFAGGGATGDGLLATGGATSGNGATLNAQASGSGAAITAAGTNTHGLSIAGAGTGNGVNAVGGATGNGIRGGGGFTSGSGILGVGGGNGAGLTLTASSNSNGMSVTGSGTGAGAQFAAGATGTGLRVVGGSTSGAGVAVVTTSGDGVSVTPTAGSALVLTANGASKHGAVITGGTSGTSDGIKAVAGTGGVDVRGNVTGNLSGNVMGSVGTVVGDIAGMTEVAPGSPGERRFTSDALVNAPSAGGTNPDIAAIKAKTDFLPSATAGTSGGVMVAGLNAATTLASLTVSGELTVGDGLVVSAVTTDKPGVQVTGNGNGEGMLITAGSGTAVGLSIISDGGPALNIYSVNDFGAVINSDSTTGLYVTSGAVDAAKFVGTAFGAGLALRGGDDGGHGLDTQGFVDGSGINTQGGVNGGIGGGGHGFYASTNAESGDGIRAQGIVYGLNATGETAGAIFQGTTNGDGLVAQAAGSGVDINADLVGDVVGNITGDLSGSVGSVVGDIAGMTETAPGSPGERRFTKDALVNSPAGSGGSGPSAATIADAVWDEVLLGHVGVGSAGAALIAAGSAGDPWSTPLPGVYGAGTAGQIMGSQILPVVLKLNMTLESAPGSPGEYRFSADALVQTPVSPGGLNAAGIRAAIGLASPNLDTQLGAIDTVVDAILVDTAEIGTAGAGLTALGDTRLANLDAAVSTRASAAALAIVAGYVDTEVAAILVVVNKLNTTLESAPGSPGEYRFTEDALINSPAGSGGGASPSALASAVWGTALPGAFGAGTAGQIIGDNVDAPISSAGGGLDAAGMRAALGMAAANLDTQLASISNDTGDLLVNLGVVDNNVDTVLSNLAAVPTANENADALLARNIEGGSSSGRIVSEALYPLRNRWDNSSGTYVVYKNDDTTIAWSSAIASDVSAEPIIGSNPT